MKAVGCFELFYCFPHFEQMIHACCRKLRKNCKKMSLNKNKKRHKASCLPIPVYCFSPSKRPLGRVAEKISGWACFMLN